MHGDAGKVVLMFISAEKYKRRSQHVIIFLRIHARVKEREIGLPKARECLFHNEFAAVLEGKGVAQR